MKTEMTRTTWEDVVFESRNKEYGAYSIRKSYDENVTKASVLMILFASFVFGCLQIASLIKIEIKMLKPIGDNFKFTVPPIIVPNPPITHAKAKTEPSVNHNLLEKVVTHQVEPVPVKPIETTLPWTETGTNTGLPDEGVVLGKGEDVIPVAVDPPKTLIIAEVMPEYEGGISAMLKFLSKNLRYPASARSISQEGTVYVRFVVSNSGQVIDVEVVKGVSAVLDREAMRVVALMKKWKPGMQHDIPVNVRMVLPIKFQLEQ